MNDVAFSNKTMLNNIHDCATAVDKCTPGIESHCSPGLKREVFARPTICETVLEKKFPLSIERSGKGIQKFERFKYPFCRW
jgi:hypothetical protein